MCICLMRFISSQFDLKLCSVNALNEFFSKSKDRHPIKITSTISTQNSKKNDS